MSTPSLITLVRLTSHCVLGGTYSQASSPLRSPEESKDLIQTKGSLAQLLHPKVSPSPQLQGTHLCPGRELSELQAHPHAGWEQRKPAGTAQYWLTALFPFLSIRDGARNYRVEIMWLVPFI